MMRLFFILLFAISLNSFGQDSTEVHDISDSCLYVRNVTSSTLQNTSCLDNEFRVYMACPIDEFNITIFNRWGEQVFFSKDIEEFWYAINTPEGTYVWLVRGKMLKDGLKVNVEKKGHVTVLR